MARTSLKADKNSSRTQKFNFTPKISKKSKQLAKNRRFSSRNKKVQDRLYEISKRKVEGKKASERDLTGNKRKKRHRRVGSMFNQQNNLSINKIRAKNVSKKQSGLKKNRPQRVKTNQSVSSAVFLKEWDDEENQKKSWKPRKKGKNNKKGKQGDLLRRKPSDMFEDLVRESIQRSCTSKNY